MHKCAGIHDAMTTLTDVKTTGSEQHIELGKSRCKCDFQDLLKIQEWFDQHEPFDVKEVALCSLSSGLTTTEGDGINPDKANEVGLKIQMQIDGLNVAEASIKRRDHIKPLANLKPGIIVDQREVNIDPTILFTRLIAVVLREEDTSPYFEYELIAFPTSLFRENFMRRAVKTQLAKSLIFFPHFTLCNSAPPSRTFSICLLCSEQSTESVSYQQIAQQYVSYVRGKYGQSCVNLWKLIEIRKSFLQMKRTKISSYY